MTTALMGAALLPAIILCVYIYIKDRVEKEPLGIVTVGSLGLVLASVISSCMEISVCVSGVVSTGTEDSIPVSISFVPVDAEVSTGGVTAVQDVSTNRRSNTKRTDFFMGIIPF